MKKRSERGGYVSRGGLKLSAALQTFGVDVTGKICMDVGSSTGGFTDCLLRHGATKIYAVDVGYGQLDWGLRKNPKVIVLERRNIRHLPKEIVLEPIDLVVIDVIFISLKTVFPAVKKFLAPAGKIIALIKPQFEVVKEEVGPKGVVRDSKLHEAVIEKIKTAGEKESWQCQGVILSPILGAEGNKEFLMLFQS